MGARAFRAFDDGPPAQQLLEAQLASLAVTDRLIGAEATTAQLRSKADRLETELFEAQVALEQSEVRIGGLLKQIDGMQVIVNHRDALLVCETWRVGAAILSPIRLIRQRWPGTRPT